jgi:plastocyanin
MRIKLIVITAGFALLSLALYIQFVLAPHPRIIDIVATIPESGGFSPDSITVQAGETVILRFRSEDVTHGVAIGPALGIDFGDLAPGEVKQVTLTFDKTGTYTFYCNHFCSLNHWRMRGVVSVTSAKQDYPTPQRDPVIERLTAEGVNIDANVSMDNSTMTSTPLPTLPFSPLLSPSRGAELALKVIVPDELKTFDWRQSHTPHEGLDMLIAHNPTIAQDMLADVMAYYWLLLPSSHLIDAETLYTKNCAICHGPTGNGLGAISSAQVKPPASFNDLSQVFTMRSDVWYAKIRRGGMGTGMPNFGTVFTPEETWALVNYLWRFSLAPQKLN